MSKSLKENVVTGVKWTSLYTIFNAIIIPIFYGLLAIMLTPTEFAYIAVITLFFRLSPILAKFGVEEAYIQSLSISKLQNSSLLMFNFVLSLITCCLLYFISPNIESYYGMDYLSLYIRLLTFAVIFESMASIFKGILKRNFLFKQNTITLIISMSLRVSLTIILIYLDYGLVSFVIAINVSTLFSLVTFIIFARRKAEIEFTFNFSLKSIKEFIQFGYPVTGKSILSLINQRADEIIIGAFFTAEVLGIYFFGKNLMSQVRTAITTSFSGVLLPLYSNIKQSTENLKNVYFKITKITAIVGFPILVGISLTADIFIPLIFGEQWDDSIIVIQILFVAVMLPIITGNNAISLLYSLGSPLKVLNIEIITFVIYLFSLGIMLMSGGEIITVLILFSLFLIINSLVLQYYVNKKLGSNLFIFITNFKSVSISLIIMAVSVYIGKVYLFEEFPLIWQLIPVVFLGGITYTLSELVFDKNTIKFLIQTVRK